MCSFVVAHHVLSHPFMSLFYLPVTLWAPGRQGSGLTGPDSFSLPSTDLGRVSAANY